VNEETRKHEMFQKRLLAIHSFDFADFDYYRLASTFAALREPRAQRIGVSLRLYAKAGLDAAIGDGQHIIKFGGVREISHAEAVEPIERTKFVLARDYNFNRKFLRVHFASITSSSKGSARGKQGRKTFTSTRGSPRWMLIDAQLEGCPRLASR
jgi:hypothetical protein